MNLKKSLTKRFHLILFQASRSSQCVEILRTSLRSCSVRVHARRNTSWSTDKPDLEGAPSVGSTIWSLARSLWCALLLFFTATTHASGSGTKKRPCTSRTKRYFGLDKDDRSWDIEGRRREEKLLHVRFSCPSIFFPCISVWNKVYFIHAFYYSYSYCIVLIHRIGYT